MPTAVPAGARSPIPSLRIAVALLAVLQLAAPLAAIAADETPATSHVDHVGADDSCHTPHDELFCLSCRVLSAIPADARPLPKLRPELVHPEGALPGAYTPHPSSDPTAPGLARAPPRI